MHKEISGVILAGGRATRMGGEDKGLVSIGGIALYQYVLARLRPQVASVAISANRNQARYQTSGLPVIGDLTPNFAGPLAGMLAGLKQSPNEWVAFVPCDVPDFPADLVAQLWQQKAQRQRPLPAMANGIILRWRYCIPKQRHSWLTIWRGVNAS